ncbi:MAG: hypothetical protein AB1805_13345 [Nitrospirota bacterium]
MELYREIRAFYIKLPYPHKKVSQDLIDKLWNCSRDLTVTSIDVNRDSEAVIHAEIEFSLESWNDAINYLRSIIGLLNVKNGFIAVRKVVATPNALRTEVESYKVTRRGVYNADLPESPDFIEDVIRHSGRNKRLQQIDAMEKLFRFIEEQEKDSSEDDAA